MTRFIRSSILVLSVLCVLAAAPATRAGMWNDERYAFDLRSYDSPDFLILNSSFLLFRLPGSRLSHARAQSVYDRDGDRTESVYRYANDVGTLANPFNMTLFNNVSGFAAGSGSKTSGLLVPDATLGTKGFDGGPAGTGTTLDTIANWSPDGIPTTSDEALLDNSIITLPSTLTLSTAQTFGDLLINSNTLTNVSLTGSTNRILTLSGGGGSTAAIAAGGATGDLLLLGTNITGSVTIGGGSGAGTLRLAIGANGNFDIVNSTATAIISNPLSGAFSLTKTGAGTLSLLGANTYVGTTLLSGTIILGASSSSTTTVITSGAVGTGTFHIGSGTNLVTVESSIAGTRTLNNNIVFDGDVTFALGPSQSTGRIAFDTIATFTTPNSIALTRTNQLTVNSSVTVDLIGAISGSTFGITKLGGGTLNIGGSVTVPTDNQNNTYSGLTIVNGGTYNLNKVAGTDAIAGDVEIDSGTLALLNAGNQIKDTASMTINGGSFSLGSKSETIANLTVNAGSVTGGSGTLTIASAGNTIVNGGTVSVTNLITGTGGLTVGSGATVSSSTSGGVTTLNGDVTFNGATTGATLGSNIAPTSGITLNGNRNFTVANATAANDLTVAGIISNGTVAGSGLTKLGAGTLLLSAVNTYTGATQVNAGTLYVNGSLNASSAVTVSNAGTVLGGTAGTINGSVSIASSALLQGGTGSTGQTLTLTGAVTMNTGSIIQLALGPLLTNSTIAIGSPGSLSFATNQDFKFIDLGATAGVYTGLITGVPDPGVALNSWVIDNPGYTGVFAWDATNGGEIDLTLTAVPEPSTWIGAALALAAIGFTQLRKRSRAGSNASAKS